jgi:predicted dehydrogenase
LLAEASGLYAVGRFRVKPFSFIQVGGGIWGRGWAEIVHRARGFRLAGLVDASAAVRSWASTELGVPAFSRLERALNDVAPDAVLLASPPDTHRPLAEAALARGLHVLCEKPLTLDLEDARTLAGIAESTGLRVMVAQNYRFRRQPRALQTLVSSGALGRLNGIRITCRRDLRNAWISRRGWRAEMVHPYLLDMGIHHVDLLRMITGQEVAQIDALAWKVPDSPFRMEPNVQALLVMVDGTPVAYEGDFAATGIETSWNGNWELVGDRARATWTGGVGNPLRGSVVLERYGSAPERVTTPALAALDRLGVLHEFRRSVADGSPPECSAADNVKSLAVILGLGSSAESRSTVRL